MEHVIDLPTGAVAVSELGSGPPVVVLHRDVVAPGDNPFISALARHHTVYAVDLPGFGRSPRPPWLRTVTQLATLTGRVIEALDITNCTLVGLGFGGWVAADLATQGCERISELVLISPWGVKPSNGEIADYVLFDLAEWAARGFHNHEIYVALCGEAPSMDLLRSWDTARESVTAVAWKPIGHNRQLPHMLHLVTLPTLVVWGEEDAIVPPGCARDWAAALPAATIVTIPEAGHQVDLEAPDQMLTTLVDFLRSNRPIEVG